MHITDIEIFKLDVPLKYPFVISLGTITCAHNLVVRLHTNTGLYGVGEACPYVFIVGETQASDFALAQDMARLLKGKNPLEVEDRMDDINRMFPFNPTVRSAFDMALYDLLGKHAGLPLYALLGGTNDRHLYTDMTVGISSPEAMAATALRFQADGFPAIKVKLGRNQRDDVARIAAIRQAIGPALPLRIDANQGWDAPTAIATLRALAAYDIEFCEEPLPRWNNRDLARVRKASPVPIMADESVFDHRDAFRLAAQGACDYFNIKLTKSGGIHSALRIAAVAEAAGMACQIGCMSETRLAITAFAHLALARRVVRYCDFDSFLMLADDPVVGGIQYLGKGEIAVPDAPGLGADVLQSWLDKAERVVV